MKTRILHLLLLYRCLTIDFLHAVLAPLSRKTVEKHVLELTRTGMVYGHAFRGNALLVYLTTKAANALGVHAARFTRPPGAQAIAENIAIFAFCQLRQPVQQRLTAAEFTAMFPHLAVKGICKTRSYLDTTDPAIVRVATLVPDYGCSVKQLARKVRREYAKRMGEKDDPTRRGWRLMLGENLAQFTVIVGTERKAERVRNALRNDPFRVIVVFVPELGDLLIRRAS